MSRKKSDTLGLDQEPDLDPEDSVDDQSPSSLDPKARRRIQSRFGVYRPTSDDILESAARQQRLSVEDYVLSLFPGDIVRARRLTLILLQLRDELLSLRLQGKIRPQESADIAYQLSREFASEFPRSKAQSAFKPPKKALELWASRNKDRRENPAQFVRRVYGPLLSRGLRLRDLSRLDPPLYRALAVWVHRHPEDEITELAPNTEDVDLQVAELADRFSPDELRRLGIALQSRLRRQKNSTS